MSHQVESDGLGSNSRRKWWIIMAVSIILGLTSGATITNVIANSRKIRADSSQIITSTGGVFTGLGDSTSAPAWSLPSLRESTKQISLAHFEGKPLVLNFWASWCTPCRKEMPAMEQVARQNRGKVVFVGIDNADQRGSALAFLAKTGVTYSVAFDPHASVASSYGVYGLPTTFFISSSGKMVGRQVGGLTRQTLGQIIKQVFPHSAGP